MLPGQMLSGQMSSWRMEFLLDVPKNLPLKFNQNQVSNIWDIPDMDKCHLDKWCLDICHADSWNLFKMFPWTYLSSLIKIGLLTAEKLLTLSFCGGVCKVIFLSYYPTKVMLGWGWVELGFWQQVCFNPNQTGGGAHWALMWHFTS